MCEIKHVKRWAGSGVLALALSFSTSSQATGIPVVDVANLANAAQQLIQLQQQYESLQNQLTVAKQRLENMSGARGYSNVISSVYQKDYDADVDSILDEYGYQDPTEYGYGEQQAAVIRGKRELDAQYLGAIEQYLEQTRNRYDQLAQLIAEVNTATDPKDVLDLQARIQAEQAMLQNEQLKITLLNQRYQIRSEMQSIKLEQSANASWTTDANLDPFTFKLD